MKSEKEPINLVGYWNGDEDSWRVSKNREKDSDILVALELEEIPVPNLATRDKKLKRSVKKVSKELRGFVRDLKKIK